MSHQKPMQTLTVFRGSSPSNAYVWSPFVTKLEARLRFGNVPYKLGAGSPRTAPKGKIPYIEVEASEDASNHAMGDSTLIIKHLVENDYLSDLNAALTPVQRAHDLSIRSMMEDRVYFYGTREKWCDNYDVMRPGVLAAVPWPLQILVGFLAKRQIVQTLYGQGTGRLDDDEALAFKEEVWEAVDALLLEARKGKEVGEEPFWVLGGDGPTEADATLFGFIAGALVCDAAPTTTRIVRGYPIIVDYAERIHQRYFPEYARWE